MGTCYSKSGHELDSSYQDKRPKERKKGSQKNGHIGSNHKPKLIVEDFDSIQKDVSDTVYTEDSHTINGLDVDNLLHKSQQTSLDMLARDANRNSDTLTACDSSEPGDINSSKENTFNCDDISKTQGSEKKDTKSVDISKEKVVTSDSGIVLECTLEPGKTLTLTSEHIAKPETCSSNPLVVPGRGTKASVCSDETKQPTDAVQNCSLLNSNVNDSKHVNSQNEHSSNNCYHDLDKLKLAVHLSNSSTPADQWSLSDSLDTGYDLPSVYSQPIRTMNMNGRDVVVIDQELFTQIMDEIQFLKMKLSQLTEVIQETDVTENSVNEGTSILSSSA